MVPGGTYDPSAIVDPAVVLFADGTYRVYYWDVTLDPPLVVSASWKPSNPSLRGFNLTLSNNESNLTIPSQETLVRTYPLEISWPPNFLGNISISASWLGATPSGINYSLSSDHVTAHWKNLLSESLNLTVNIDSSAAQGNYSLRILGSSGGVTESTTQSINLRIAFNPDINKDGTVNILDIAIVAKAFGSRLGDLNWNPVADLNKDGVVNRLDLTMVAEDFGKTV